MLNAHIKTSIKVHGYVNEWAHKLQQKNLIIFGELLLQHIKTNPFPLGEYNKLGFCNFHFDYIVLLLKLQKFSLILNPSSFT
jgi:hypothetical protein